MLYFFVFMLVVLCVYLLCVDGFYVSWLFCFGM